MGIPCRVIIALALTGATGLVYKVAWQEYLAILLGAQSETSAAIVEVHRGPWYLIRAGVA